MSMLYIGMFLGLPHLEMAGWGGIYRSQHNSSHAKAYDLEEVGSSPQHIFHDISKAAIFSITMVGVIVLKSSML
jgi:hypothetical protein